MSSARTRKLLSMHSQKSTLASRANCEHLCRRRKWPSASSRTSLGQPPQARASKKSPKSHSVRMQNGQNVIFLPFSPLALTDQRSRVQSPCSTGNTGILYTASPWPSNFVAAMVFGPTSISETACRFPPAVLSKSNCRHLET